MKKFIFILPIILVSILMSVSCTKETDDTNNNNINTSPKETLLTKYEVSTAITTMSTSISYTKSLLPEIIKESEQNTLKLVRKYSYNVSKLVDAKLYSDEAMSVEVGTETYTYNSSSQITAKTRVLNGETINYTYTWAGGKITEVVGLTVGASFNDFKKVYEWTGDNITKVTNYQKDTVGNFTMTDYEVYTFDSKVNPFVIKVFPNFEDVLYINKNNVTKIEFYDSYDVIQGMADFTYTFDADNRPLTGTFDFAFMSGIYNFTYTELAKE